MHCAKGDFPHAQYAFYLHTIDTWRAVKRGIAAVTWCDVTANHRCAAHSIPHFTFRIPHGAVPRFTHSRIFSTKDGIAARQTSIDFSIGAMVRCACVRFY